MIVVCSDVHGLAVVSERVTIGRSGAAKTYRSQILGVTPSDRGRCAWAREADRVPYGGEMLRNRPLDDRSLVLLHLGEALYQVDLVGALTALCSGTHAHNTPVHGPMHGCNQEQLPGARV